LRHHIEITPTEIKYKKCNQLDGPTLIKSKSEVFMLKYANGEKEMITQSYAAAAPVEEVVQTTNEVIGYQDYSGGQQKKGLAIVALVAGILGFLIPGMGIIGIVFAAIAKSKIKKDPENYGGKGMAAAGLVCGIIATVLWAGLFIIASTV